MALAMSQPTVYVDTNILSALYYRGADTGALIRQRATREGCRLSSVVEPCAPGQRGVVAALGQVVRPGRDHQPCRAALGGSMTCQRRASGMSR